jgi:YtkA-like
VYVWQANKEESMRYLVAVATVATALIASSAASAGGWATVGVDPLPSGVGPGDTWNTNLTILQHGLTPLTGLSPTVTITLDDGSLTETFTATETDEPGVYAASVVFPEAGPWRIVADSTFGESRLTFGPVSIEPTPGAGDGSGREVPVVPVLALVAGLVVIAAGTLGVLRQRRLRPAA